MGETGPQPGQRPADYQEVLHFLKSTGRSDDRLIRLELLDMAEGGNPKGGNPDPGFKGIREEYYQGWNNEDFKALLADLGFPIKE